MEALLPYDLSPNTLNKYLNNFYFSLKNENINIIASSKEWIKNSKIYDIVLIHWPEYLPKLENQSEEEFLNFTIDRLNYFRKFGKILYFVHNEKPHGTLSKIQNKLYNSVLSKSDYLFHFSHFSKNLYKNKYKNIQKHFIVPHGNYVELQDHQIQTAKLLKDFKLDSSKLIVCSVGCIRNRKELEFLYNFAKEYLNLGCHFIYAGDLVGDINNPKSSGKILYNLKKLLKNLIRLFRFLKLKLISKNIRIIPNIISNQLLVEICQSSDILLILRNCNLNSGNIALAFTFGCYVVGPNIGNIGEILREYNNMVFSIKYTNYKRISKESINNFNSIIADNNKKIALNDWDWKKIANNLKYIFEEF